MEISTPLRLLAVICFCLTAAVTVGAQNQAKPNLLSKDDVVQLLSGGVSPRRVFALLQERGMDFQLTADTEKQLRQAGADDELILALRSLAAKAPSVVTPPAAPASPQPGSTPSNTPAAQNAVPKFLEFPLRFPVAHEHAMSWCYGYLLVTPDRIRYEVIQPMSEEHSFDVPLSDMKSATKWMVMGSPLPVLELRLPRGVYHFRWLSNASEVNSGAPRRASPPDALDPSVLVETLRDPVGVRARFIEAYREKEKARASGAPGAASAGMPANTEAAGGKATSAATLGSRKLDGLYMGYRGGYASYLSSAPTVLDKAFILFYPDGWFVTVDPKAGVPGSNAKAVLAATNKNSRGRYETRENSVLLNYDGGEHRIIALVGSGAQAGLEKFVRLCRCDGLQVTGTFHKDQSSLTFAADGRFIDRGLIQGLLSGQGQPRDTMPGSGTYKIMNNKLQLSYSDGRQVSTFFAAADQAATPPWIILNMSQLERSSQ